jgi:heptaprenyl diphosphate synthase
MSLRVRKLARLALLLALATVIHTAEALLPINVLWFRFGFANIIGIAVLYLYGFKDAFLLTLGRIFLGSLAAGLFGSPAFLLSFAGGTSAMLTMGMVHRYASRLFSEVGISVIGAVTHNVVQLFVAYVILIRSEGLLLLLPLMILASLGTGVINGIAARFVIAHFRKIDTPA